MSKQLGTTPARAKRQLPWDKFYSKHKDPLDELLKGADERNAEGGNLRVLARSQPDAKLRLPTRSPLIIAADRLNEMGIGPMLRAAEAENCPEAVKTILQVLFSYMGVNVPKGVFTSKVVAGKPGRPVSSKSELIHSTWIKIGKPSLFKNELAQAFHGVEFAAASGTTRRNLRDQCRHAVERHIEREVDKLQHEITNVKKETAQLRECLGRMQEQLKRLGRTMQ